VDYYYSNFIEVDRLENSKSKTVISKLKQHFSRHGIPDQVMSDNGPQFSSEHFKDFSSTWEFEHLTSSPGYPHSNGMAESAVKTVKNIMKKIQESRN